MFLLRPDKPSNPMYAGHLVFNERVVKRNAHPAIVYADNWQYAFDHLSDVDLDGNPMEWPNRVVRYAQKGSTNMALLAGTRDNGKLVIDGVNGSHVYVNIVLAAYALRKKELLLSPATGSAIITGKVLAGFITTVSLGALVLCLGYALGWMQPEGVYWLSALLVIGLVALLSSGLGVAIGALTQRVQAVIAISINIALYLFFLAGGTGVLAFEPGWLQNIAAFVPLTYGDHALQMAVFYSSADQLGRDVAVLGFSALAAVILGILAMRRGIAH
jgi:hypothetical protein